MYVTCSERAFHFAFREKGLIYRVPLVSVPSSELAPLPHKRVCPPPTWFQGREVVGGDNSDDQAGDSGTLYSYTL